MSNGSHCLGQFFYVEWPHSDSAGAAGIAESKSRPALAVTEPDGQGDLTLLKVTGRSGYSRSVGFTQEDLQSGTLLKPSFVRTDRWLTINVAQLWDWGARLSDRKLTEVLREVARANASTFSHLNHRQNRPGSENASPFTPGVTTIPYAGRVFTEDEVEAAVGATLDFWLTLGPEGDAFENELANFLGVKRSILVNSGSSANLVAFSALTSHKLRRPPHPSRR